LPPCRGQLQLLERGRAGLGAAFVRLLALVEREADQGRHLRGADLYKIV
jgi:hypothetical protein